MGIEITIPPLVAHPPAQRWQSPSMHASTLTQLAATAAHHGHLLIHETQTFSVHAVQEYWMSSKCRLDRWASEIKYFQQQIRQASALRRARLWSEIEPVLEEVLFSEVLTRVWNCLLCGMDRRRFAGELEPVARSVFVGHLEARRRTLHLLVFGRGVGAHPTERLNRLRRDCECWTDMLLGSLLPSSSVRQFAFDARHPYSFATDVGLHAIPPRNRFDLALFITWLNLSSREHDLRHPANPDLNERIANSVLAIFSEDLFNETGQIKSLWQARLPSGSDHHSVNVAGDLFGPLWSASADRNDRTDKPTRRF